MLHINEQQLSFVKFKGHLSVFITAKMNYNKNIHLLTIITFNELQLDEACEWSDQLEYCLSFSSPHCLHEASFGHKLQFLQKL